MDYASIILRIIGSKRIENYSRIIGKKNSNKKRIIGPSFVEYT